MNTCTGVVGVFNCQGAGWCKIEKKTRIHDASPGTLSGSVRSTDVDCIAQVASPDWSGETIVYAYKSGKFTGVFGPCDRVIDIHCYRKIFFFCYSWINYHMEFLVRKTK